jgi:hypothetical protein
MDKSKTTPDKPDGTNARLLARRKREAEALRANLSKRKAQTRARKAPKQE